MKKTILFWGILLLFLAAACMVNPVTGKKELSLISENGEIALGENTDKEIRAQYGTYEDERLTQYITRVGMSLVPHSHRPHLPYTFAVLDTPVVNAFAVPGGYIYVTRGVLAMMNSEAELSTVLGHELGHVNARHSVRKLSQMILVQVGLAVGSALSETFSKISGVASIGIQLLFLKFSRDDEREADLLGVEYARKGGYNPSEIVPFFTSLQKLGDLSGGSHLPGFLSTHPLTPERIKNTRAMILESDTNLRVDRTLYLNSLNDMVFGDDPRQGFVEGSTFYHPLLRFSFSFPQEWKLQNTPSQVVLTSKDGQAAVVLQAEKSSETPSACTARKADLFEGKQVINEGSLTINGLASYQKLFDVPQEEKETLRIRISCIQKGSYLFTFTALSTSEKFNAYDFHFGTMAGSFNELKDRTLLNRQPKRLKLIKASGKESLKKIFQDNGMEKDLWPKFAVMNGLNLDQNPEPNRLVKIAK